MKGRIERIFRHLDEQVDAIVVMNGVEPHIDRTFFYASGIKGGLFEGCVALLLPDGSCRILSSRLEADIAKAFGNPVEVFSIKEERQTALQRLLADSQSIGINGREITYSAYADIQAACPGARLSDISKAVTRARQVKDEAEVKSLVRACDIAVEAFEELLPYIQVGRSEAEIAAELVYLMQGMGSSGPSFPPIVASGPNSALPHYTTGRRRVREGDFLLMDFGALSDGYASDMTRTVVLGKADRRQMRIHEVVLQAHLAALEAMGPGVDGRKVHEIARGVIDSSEFKDRFTHSLGHTIGLSVHDGAAMRPSESLLLEEGMAITVEPGIYLPEYGGVRVEDDVLITGDGSQVLTPATRELLEV